MATDGTDSAGAHAGQDPAAVPPGFESYAANRTDGVSTGSPGKDGLLEAEFTRSGDRTRLTHQYTRVPYHLGRELDYDAPFAAVRIQSPTAGIGQDDRLRLEVTAGPGSRAHVSGASSTKVFGMDHGFGQSTLTVRAESAGYVELFPEPTILHAGSRFHQPVELSAAPDGAVVYGDVVVPGRLARGERFEFDHYVNVVDGVDPDGLAFRDAVDIKGDDDLTGPGVFGPHSVLGTLYVLAPAVDAESLSDRLHDRVREAMADTASKDDQDTGRADAAVELGTESAVDAESTVETEFASRSDRSEQPVDASQPSVTASASTLPRSGVVVRALGPTGPTVTEALAAARDSVRRELVGQPAPDPRRW